MKYEIKIDQDALLDIKQATEWYDHQLIGLGLKFQKQLITQINSLKTNPNLFAIRYDNVRCLILKKFPFIVHFTIDEINKSVEIFAIFHTSRNPMIWLLKKK